MRKTQILMNKPVYLGLSILKVSKIVMYEFWYDYVKPTYKKRQIMLHGDRPLYSLHKKENILLRRCKRC